MVAIHVYDARAERIGEAVGRVAGGREVMALSSREALDAALPEIEVLFAPRPPREGWARAARLRLVQLLGVGADGLLPAPDLPERVAVGCARGEFAAEAAEHAVALVLALCRDLPALVHEQREARFRQRPAPSLAGKTAVLFGVGAIGGRVARALDALGVRVIGVCRRPRPIAHVHEVMGTEQLDAALPRADYLVVTAPLTPATERRLDARALALLPRGARLVCVSRGGIVDETALVAALERGDLAGAALDVFEREPLPEESPLWRAPRLLVTPHVAGLGERYVERCAALLVANVERLERGEPLAGLVDRTLGY